MRRILIILFLLLVSAGVSYLLVMREMRHSISAFEVLPETPVFVLQAEGAPALLAELGAHPSFKSLESIGLLSKLSSGLEYERTLYTDTAFQRKMQDAPTVAAAYMTRAGNFDYLLVRSLEGLSEKRPGKVSGLNWANTKSTTFERKTIYTSITAEDSTGLAETENWHFTISHGVLVASNDLGLIEDAILHMRNGKELTKDDSFEKLSTAKLDAGILRVYVNYNSLADFLSVYAADDFAPRLNRLANFGAWSALDMKIDDESIFINGLSTTTGGKLKSGSVMTAGIADAVSGEPHSASQSDKAGNKTSFLQRFSATDTFGRQIEHVLPGNTSLLFRLAGAELGMLLADQPDWTAPEWAFGVTTTLDGEWLNRSFVCVRLKSLEAATTSLDVAAAKVFKLDPASGANLSAGIFQSAEASSSTDLWAALIGEYLLIAPNEQFLQRILAKRKNGQTLANEPGYLHYRQRLLDNANVFIYADMQDLEPVLKQLLAKKYQENFEQGFAAFRNIQPVALQLDKHRDLFLTTGYIWKNTELATGDVELWRSPMDSSVAMRPVLVRNHATGATEVLVQDKADKLYLFSRDGDLIWSRQLDGPVLGEISQVDYYKNRKLQYLLSTAGNIYMIDRKGRNVADFPIKLTAKASNGVFVVDYENKRDYRMFISSTNGNLYGYYKTGKPLPGWSPKRKAGQITQPLKHFSHKSKDYLFAFNEKGTIYLWDRRGDKRIKPIELKTQLLGEVVLDKSGAKPYLLAADTIGNIYRIGLDGKHSHIQVPRVDNTTDFAIANVRGDSKPEYLVLTGQQLDVFDHKGKRCFSYKLPDPSGNSLQLVSLPKSSKQTICVLSALSGEWLALDEEGNTLAGFPVSANGAFTAGAIQKNEVMLVGGNNNNLLLQHWPN